MKHLSLFILFLIYIVPSFSQAPKVAKPVYFDITPPLRDMVQSIPGPEDRSWKDGVIMNYFPSDKEIQSPNDAAWMIDPGFQSNDGILTGDTIISNFDAIWNTGGYVPPDTYGEAGPNVYFQVVNCSYAIFNKSGGRIFGPMANSTVWSGMPNNENSGDAVVLYDEMADRWLFTQFSLPFYPNGPFYQMIAVSQTADPTGSWYRYQYEFDDMPDYPKFGVWTDGYYMSENTFGAGGSGWVGNGMYAYDRDAMLSGEPDATRISFRLYPGSAGFITLYPSDCDGVLPPAGTPNYFAYIRNSSPQALCIYEFHADFTNPGQSTFGNLLTLPVNSFTMHQGGIPQKGTSVKLETISDRLMYRLQYRLIDDHASMVVNHTVGAGSGKAGVRWYELRKTTGDWTIHQQSTYAPDDNNSRWMGSIAMDTAGSIALGYSVSGPDRFPSIAYTGRKKNDPLNQMTIAEKTIKEGGGCQTGIWSGRSRWGDYSGMSIDPENPTTFWYTTEYYPNTGTNSWLTRVASFTFDNVFSIAASATPAKFCQGDSSQLMASAYGGSQNYTYSWTSIPPGFTSNLKDPVVYPTDTTQYIVVISDGSQSKSDTATVAVVQHPNAFAGNDTTICAWLNALELHGTASGYKYVRWGTMGDGHFANSYTLNTIYYPGNADRANGGVELALIAFANSPCQGKVFSYMHITIDACTGLNEPSETGSVFTLSPNPASGTVTLNLSNHDSPASVTITGMDGRRCYQESVHPDENRTLTIDISGLSPGVYSVRVQSEAKMQVRQLVVR